MVFDPTRGYPAGPSVQYECLQCGDVLPSIPRNAMACACDNAIVDADAGRVAVKRHEHFKAFQVIKDHVTTRDITE